jgi:hypothetical protein
MRPQGGQRLSIQWGRVASQFVKLFQIPTKLSTGAVPTQLRAPTSLSPNSVDILLWLASGLGGVLNLKKSMSKDQKYLKVKRNRKTPCRFFFLTSLCLGVSLHGEFKNTKKSFLPTKTSKKNLPTSVGVFFPSAPLDVRKEEEEEEEEEGKVVVVVFLLFGLLMERNGQKRNEKNEGKKRQDSSLPKIFVTDNFQKYCVFELPLLRNAKKNNNEDRQNKKYLPTSLVAICQMHVASNLFFPKCPLVQVQAQLAVRSQHIGS